ncbi:MAG: PRC-barrel domain-containing protein, partial [Propionibacteriaceae bacterium]|nr:PRC-barrel domain-containing protein [Propionibacteriaceae bacterium]
MTKADLERIVNATAYDPSGDKLGKVGQLYLDDQTEEPTFVSVKTGLFGLSESLVPLRGHSWNGEDLVLPFEKDIVKNAPNIDADRHLSEQEQDDLFAYYAGLQGDSTGARDRLGGGRPLDTTGADRSDQVTATGVMGAPDTGAVGDTVVDRDARRTEGTADTMGVNELGAPGLETAVGTDHTTAGRTTDPDHATAGRT